MIDDTELTRQPEGSAPGSSCAEPVWVVDDDRAIRWVLNRALARAGISCRTFERG